VAKCQVRPPSVETSTAPTAPPLSTAVPVIVAGVPMLNWWPAAGAVMAEVGGSWSVEGLPRRSPDCSVAGWAPMSPSRFTVACWTIGSSGTPGSVEWKASRP
jgi:hypothetical protein